MPVIGVPKGRVGADISGHAIRSPPISSAIREPIIAIGDMLVPAPPISGTTRSPKGNRPYFPINQRALVIGNIFMHCFDCRY
jgi:hypothetical protein